jgi:hypothetical protein
VATNKIFIVIDGDDVGAHIESLILRGKLNELKNFSENYKKSMQWLSGKLQRHFQAEVVFEGGDSLLAICSIDLFNKSNLEDIREEYQLKAQRTISIGIGLSLITAYIGLKLAKTGGKDCLVDMREIQYE